MSAEGLRDDARRWLEQALDDLHGAQVLTQAGHHALAAFHAQQAGEKALKALWRSLDLDPRGHSVAKLVDDLPITPAGLDLADLKTIAIALDKLYIPTRYPDALPGLTPAQAYTAEEAARAITDAGRLVDAVRSVVEEASAPQQSED